MLHETPSIPKGLNKTNEVQESDFPPAAFSGITPDLEKSGICTEEYPIEEARLRACDNALAVDDLSDTPILYKNYSSQFDEKEDKIQDSSRRNFLKLAGTAILASTIGGDAMFSENRVQENPQNKEVPNISPSSEVAEEFAPRISLETQKKIDQESIQLDQRTREQIDQFLAKNNLSFDDPQVQKIYHEGYALKERHGEINGQKLDFVGVHHEPGTLLFKRAELEEKISRSGAIVLEGAPQISGLRSPEAQAFIRNELILSGESEDYADTWIRINIINNDFDVFFHEMEQLAKKHQKPIITADPHSGPDRELELMKECIHDGDKLKKLEELIHFGLASAFGVAALGGTASMAVGSVANQESKTRSPYEADKTEENTLPNPGRRKFLAGMASLAVAGAALPTIGISLIDADPGKHALGDGKILSPLLYGLIDYRNVIVARGLDQLTKKQQFDGPLLTIYGEYHTDPMMQYLSSPTLRDVKYELYAPFRDKKSPQLGEYVYDEESSLATGGSYWHEVRKEKI